MGRGLGGGVLPRPQCPSCSCRDCRWSTFHGRGRPPSRMLLLRSAGRAPALVLGLRTKSLLPPLTTAVVSGQRPSDRSAQSPSDYSGQRPYIRRVARALGLVTKPARAGDSTCKHKRRTPLSPGTACVTRPGTSAGLPTRPPCSQRGSGTPRRLRARCAGRPPGAGGEGKKWGKQT